MKNIISLTLILTFSINQLTGLGYAHGDTLRPLSAVKGRAADIQIKLSSAGLADSGKEKEPLDLREAKEAIDRLVEKFKRDSIKYGDSKSPVIEQDSLSLYNAGDKMITALVDKGRLGDLDDFMDYLDKVFLRLHKETGCAYDNVHIFYSDVSIKLLEKLKQAKGGLLAVENAPGLEITERFAKKGADIIKRYKPRARTMNPYTVLLEIYRTREQYENVIELAKDALILGSSDENWYPSWLLELIATYYKYKGNKSDKITLVLNELLYALIVKKGIKNTTAAEYMATDYSEAFFLDVKSLQRAVAILEDSLVMVDQTYSSDSDLDNYRYHKSGIMQNLAFAYLALGGKENYCKAINYSRKAMELGEVTSGIKGVLLSARKMLAYETYKEDKKRGWELFDDFLTVTNETIFTYSNGEPYSEEDLDRLRQYSHASIAYLKGDYIEAEEAYRKMIEDSPGDLLIYLLYDYVDILLNLNRREEAEGSLRKLFEAMSMRNLDMIRNYGVTLFEYNFIRNKEQLQRVSGLIREELSDINRWTKLEPEALRHMLRFLLAYDNSNFAGLKVKVLGYLSEARPGVDFLPYIKAMALALYEEDPVDGRSFIRKAVVLYKGGPMEAVLDKFLREELTKGALLFDEYFFHGFLYAISGSTQAVPLISKECINAVEASFLRNNDDIAAMFDEIEEARKRFTQSLGYDTADTFIYNMALTMLLLLRDNIFISEKDKKAFREKIGAGLAGFTKRYEKAVEIIDKNRDDNTVRFYKYLSDLMKSTKEYSIAADIQKRLIKLYKKRDDFLGASELSLDIAASYAVNLMYVQKDEEAQEAFALWVRGANALIDKAEMPQNAGDKERLLSVVVGSVERLEHEMLARASLLNDNIKPTLARAVDKWLDGSIESPSASNVYVCAQAAGFILRDNNRAERLVKMARRLHTESGVSPEFPTAEGILSESLLGYTYNRRGEYEAGREAFSLAERAMSTVSSRKFYNQTMIMGLRVINSVLKGEYAEAISTINRDIEMLESDSAYEEGKYFSYLYLVLAYLMNNQASLADETLRKALRQYMVVQEPQEGKRKKKSIGRSKFDYYGGDISILPEDLRNVFIDFLYKYLFRDDISNDEAAIILNMFEVIDPEYVITMLISHFEDIIYNDTKFMPEHDMRLLRWLASIPNKRSLIIDNLLQRLAVSGKLDASTIKILSKVRVQKGGRPIRAEDYPMAVRYLYEIGEFARALRLIKQGLDIANREGKANIINELESLQSEIQSTFEMLGSLVKAYEADDYDTALMKCKSLLSIHPDNAVASNIKENIACLKEAREFFRQADIDRTVKCLSHIPHEDRKIRHIRNGLDRLSQITKDASSLIDENRYLAAEKKLSEIPDNIMGIEIGPDSILLKGLYNSIKGCRDKAKEYESAIAESNDAAKIYEAARNLLNYPEHKGRTFELIIQKAVALYNQGLYKDSFNIARLIYELKDYNPDECFIKKARHIISHAVSSFWIPKLTNDYFIVKTMATAELYRDQRDRQDRHLGQNAPISFEFTDFKLTSKGFVLSGFGDIDIEKFVLSGDSFRIRPRNVDEDLQPLFRTSIVSVNKRTGKYEILFKLPPAMEGYDYIISLLEASLSDGGTITRISNNAWVNQCDMLDSIIRSLKNTTQKSLKEDINELSLATTSSKSLDRALGMLLDMPKDKKEADRSREEALVEEQQKKKGIIFDPEQRDALVDGLDESIPSSFCQGPGGTGKTFVITTLTEMLLMSKKRVRILSQTNAAVDVIGEQLIEGDIFYARVGNNEEAIAAKVRQIWKERADRVVAIRDSKKPNLILATINGFYSDSNIQFNEGLMRADVIIIDESSRATVPESLWALYKWLDAKKFIFVGDHFQLPAYGIAEEEVQFAKKEFKEKDEGELKIESLKESRSLNDIFNSAKIDDFRISLLEKILTQLFDTDKTDIYKVTKPNFHFFKVNRRSARYIVELDNYFYKGRLIAGRDEKGIVIEDDYNKGIDDPSQRFNEDKTGANNEDKYNKKEISRVVYWLNELLNKTDLDPKEIAVITPYDKQVDFIKGTLLGLSYIFDILKAAEDNNIDFNLNDLMELIHDEYGILECYLEQMHGKNAMQELRNKFIFEFSGKEPSEKAKELKGFFGFGDRFIPSELLEKDLFSVTTVDSAIGSEWKAVILSWVRSNFKEGKGGNVGFLAQAIDGFKRRNVGIGRARNILINIWDRDTFENATPSGEREFAEIRRWASHNIGVFKRAKDDGCADMDIYRDMFKTKDSAVPVDMIQESLKQIDVAA